MNRRILNRRSLVAIIALMVALLMPLGLTLVYAAGGTNPRVVPNQGPMYGDLGAKWWQWALKFSFADVPFFNTGGPVDISAGQSGNVWFLAGSNNGLPNGPRTGVIPAGKALFFPLANAISDYPCPPEFNFEPPPGETLEHFLQRTGNEFLDSLLPPDHPDLFAEIDGVSLTNLSAYRATSSMFMFTADPTLVGDFFDPCITGSSQPGVAVGYWLLLPPLTPGTHTLHFGAPSYFKQDVTYVLTVKP